jgi:hypothetical protein
VILPRTAVLLALAASGCGRVDWFPPERWMRAAFNGWDMWAGTAVRPYETPMPAVPEGTVPFQGTASAVNGFGTYEQALAVFEALPTGRDRWGDLAETRALLGAQAYARYCDHCHGPNGDGRVIVGESFSPRLPDLRNPVVQQKDDATLWARVRTGGGNMIPLADTLTPLDTLLAVHHVRSLAGAPSVPFIAPKDVEPLE